MATPARRTRRLSTQTVVLWLLFFLALWVALRVLLVPDPGGKLLVYARALQLEQAGLPDEALRQYALLAKAHAESEYAPIALQREASILTDQGHAGKTESFDTAIGIYQSLAKTYPQSAQAGPALLAAAAIYANDKKDYDGAAHTYDQVLKLFPGNADLASQATLGLGRTALNTRDSDHAMQWLQMVLQKYGSFPERCAEAQFHLGEMFETLDHNHVAARDAYEATLKNYPDSLWAGNAKEQLGLLLYETGAPRARRVIISIPPHFSESDSSSIEGALLSICGARGMDIDLATLRGWSLTPFFAGLLPGDLAHVPAAPFDDWQTAAATAGMRFSRFSGGDARSALGDLQAEIDAAHLTLLYNGDWRLVSGYDAGHNFVYLRQGAQENKVSTADLSRSWDRSSPVGGSFSMLSFSVPGEDDKVAEAAVTGDAALAAAGATAPNGTALLPTPTPPPGGASAISKHDSGLQPPTFVYELKTLSTEAADRRALSQAANWLHRSRSGAVLVNGEALRYLANETGRLADAGEAASATGSDAADALDGDAPVRVDSNATDDPNATPAPNPTAAPAPPLAPAAQRARQLLAWKGAPLQSWLAGRGQAASYLDIAGSRLHVANLHSAAQALREEISDLENAGAALPAEGNLTGADGALTDKARIAFGQAAKSFEKARAADSRAADLVAAG